MKGGRAKLLAPTISESADTIVSRQTFAAEQVVSRSKRLRFRPGREVLSAKSSESAPVAGWCVFRGGWLCNVRRSVRSDMA